MASSGASSPGAFAEAFVDFAAISGSTWWWLPLRRRLLLRHRHWRMGPRRRRAAHAASSPPSGAAHLGPFERVLYPHLHRRCVGGLNSSPATFLSASSSSIMGTAAPSASSPGRAKASTGHRPIKQALDVPDMVPFTKPRPTSQSRSPGGQAVASAGGSDFACHGAALRDCLLLPFGRCQRPRHPNTGTEVFGRCARPRAVCATSKKGPRGVRL